MFVDMSGLAKEIFGISNFSPVESISAEKDGIFSVTGTLDETSRWKYA
jgi:hypothetical protein